MSAPTASNNQNDPNSPTPEELRLRLVEKLRRENVLQDAAVEHALLTVPRHLFLPHVPVEEAYGDMAILTHEENGVPVSSASQPAIVAIMLQQLGITPGMRILEIGAGTGYNAALLAELTGPSGHVTTVDIGAQIALEARAHLEEAGYAAVRVVAADGAAGWAENAPYDRIELTVGAADITPAWYEQLAQDGVITLPLSLGASDASVALRKHAGALVSESLAPCGFMRLRGSEKSGMEWVSLGNGLRLGSEEAQELAEPVRALLASRPRRRLQLAFDAAMMHWLGLRGLRLVLLSSEAQRRRTRVRYGIYAEGPDGPSLSVFAARMPLLISYGGSTAERQITEEAARWQTTRRIPVDQWHITAWPHYTGSEPPPVPEGAYRQARRYFTYDIQMSE